MGLKTWLGLKPKKKSRAAKKETVFELGSNCLRLVNGIENSRAARLRRQQLNGLGLPSNPRVLEIGAFDNPTIVPQDGVLVRFADYFSAEELRAKHRDNPRRRLDLICSVDFVVRGPRLSEHIHETFDLIIGNHLIEHIPNPIGWMQDLAKLANRPAVLFLTVPDMRYCFDYLKPPTDLVDLVRAFRENKERPDVYDVVRGRYYHKRVEAPRIWAGEKPSYTAADIKYDLPALLLEAEEQVGAGYVDCHCSFFTRDSFSTIFSNLHRFGMIPWRLRKLSHVIPNGNEFYAAFDLA